jgi:hypothetical protein
MTSDMKRREFITLLGGAAAAPSPLWPFEAHAQQPDRMLRIGVLDGGIAADDPEGKASFAAFVQELQQLGWTEGRNVRIDYRWGLGDANNIRKYAGGIGCAYAGRHPAVWHRDRQPFAAGDPDRADRVHDRR